MSQSGFDIDQYDYERPKSNFENEGIQYNRELYTPDLEITFKGMLNTSRLTPRARAILKSYFNYAVSKDLVLANRTSNQASIDLKKLRLRLDKAKMSLRGKDILSKLTPAWDDAAEFIILVAQSRIQRSIDGWERDMQQTQKMIQKTDVTQNTLQTLNEARNRRF